MDTLAYTKRLRAAGVPEAQAEAHAEALKQASADELVTKLDLERAKYELIKWFAVLLFAQAGAIVALIKLLP